MDTAILKCLWLLIVLVLTAVAGNFVSGRDTSNEGRYLKIPALGRTAQLGHLYNEVLDDFRDVSIFRTSTLFPEFITTAKKPKLVKTIGLANTYQEQFRLLNIQPSVAANILSGLTQVVEGSYSFLNDQYSSNHIENEVTGLLIQKSRTVQESLQIFHCDLTSLYNKHVLNHKEATHVVTGIEWGSDISVRFTDQVKSNQTMADASSFLLKQMEEFKKTPFAPADLNSTISMSVFSDLPLPFEASTNQGQVYDLLKEFPGHLDSVNDGKGLQMKYTLTPISVVREIVGLNSESSNSAYELNEKVLKDIVDISDDIAAVERQIRTLQSRLCNQQQRKYLLPQSEEKLNEILGNVQKSKSNFITTLKKSLIEERSSNVNNPGLTLRDFTKEYALNEFTGKTVNDKLSQFNNDLERSRFFERITSLHSNRVKYFGLQNNLELEIGQSLNHPVYLIFYKTEFANSNNKDWQGNLHTFLSHSNKSGNKLGVVDCDLEQSICENISRPLIHEYRNGRRASLNVEENIVDEERNVQLQIRELNETLKNTIDLIGTQIKEELRLHQLSVINGDTVKWARATPGTVPWKAVEGGKEDVILYVARAYHEGYVIPSKYIAKYNTPFVPYKGKEIQGDNFEILCAPSKLLLWVSASNGNVPENAIKGGEDKNGETFYIGRFKKDGELVIGNVVPSQGVCYIPYHGVEYTSATYEVLVLA